MNHKKNPIQLLEAPVSKIKTPETLFTFALKV